MFLFFVLSFNAFSKILWLGNAAWDFWGVKFWCRDFFGFWVLPPFNHPSHLKSGIPPFPWGGRKGLEKVIFLMLQRLYPCLKSNIVGWIQVFSRGGLMKGGHLCRGAWGHTEIPIWGKVSVFLYLIFLSENAILFSLMIECIYFTSLQVFDVSCFNLWGFIRTPWTPSRSTPEITLIGTDIFTLFFHSTCNISLSEIG